MDTSSTINISSGRDGEKMALLVVIYYFTNIKGTHLESNAVTWYRDQKHLVETGRYRWASIKAPGVSNKNTAGTVPQCQCAN